MGSAWPKAWENNTAAGGLVGGGLGGGWDPSWGTLPKHPRGPRKHSETLWTTPDLTLQKFPAKPCLALSRLSFFDQYAARQGGAKQVFMSQAVLTLPGMLAGVPTPRNYDSVG
jgi:hypothetical protein